MFNFQLNFKKFCSIENPPNICLPGSVFAIMLCFFSIHTNTVHTNFYKVRLFYNNTTGTVTESFKIHILLAALAVAQYLLEVHIILAAVAVAKQTFMIHNIKGFLIIKKCHSLTNKVITFMQYMFIQMVGCLSDVILFYTQEILL